MTEENGAHRGDLRSPHKIMLSRRKISFPLIDIHSPGRKNLERGGRERRLLSPVYLLSFPVDFRGERGQ